jgi:hypothetical protein
MWHANVPRRRTRRLVVGIVAVATALVLVPAAARAQPATASVVVWAEGPDADQARAEVTGALGSDARSVDPGAWRDAFRSAGRPESLARDLARSKTRAAALDRAQRAATAAGVDEVVLVTTSRAKGGGHLVDAYLVSPGQQPQVLAHVPLGAATGGLGAAVHDKIVAAHPPPARAAPAQPPSPPVRDDTASSAPVAGRSGPEASADATADATSPSASARVRHVSGRDLVDVSVGNEVGGRTFTFNDPLTGNLRSYHLGAAPLLVADGAVYPFLEQAAPVDVGVVAGFAQAYALQSAASESGSISTHWNRWYAGARVRLRTGTERAPVVGVQVTYGSEAFTFDGNDPSGTFPSVTYSLARAAGDVRVPLGRFAAMSDVGYLAVGSEGDVGSRFPHASVGGIDFGMGAAYVIGSGFEARVEGNYRRFFYAMNSVPGDAFVAGGAFDEFWGARVKVAYVF